MNAIIVNFKNSIPTPKTSQFFQVLFGYFLQNLNRWVDEFDRVYLLDSGWHFNSHERDVLDKATNSKWVIVETNPNTPYMQAFAENLSLIKEDNVLFMHDDTIIYGKGFVKQIFENLTEFDIVSAFEEIGTLTERINNKWPVMKGYSNFASALFGFKLDMLKPFKEFPFEASYQYPINTYIPELDYKTVEGDWVETLGRASITILGKEAKVLQIPQDKSYLFYNTPPSKEINIDTDWHHMRYGFAIARMFTNKYYGWPEQYKDDLQPWNLVENLRKLAWFCVANKNPYFTVEDKYIWELLADAKVEKSLWLDYLDKFKKFHHLEEA